MSNKKRIKPTTLRKIQKSRAIENNLRIRLSDFTNKIIKSFNYWVLAQYNKKQRSEIKNLSTALRISFNDLINKWESDAIEIAKSIANKSFKEVQGYVDSQLLKQNKDFKNTISKSNNSIKEVKKASILEQIALIKSIPREILRRYEGSLYANVDNFDMQAIYKQLRTIKGISNRRAKTIARDQTAKAIETYQNAKCQQLGFEYYVWSTAGDERVSKGYGGHRILNDRIYRYDTPTAIIDSYGNIGHCSQRVNCRCLAIPLILQPNQKLKKIKDTQAGDYYILIEN